MSDDTAKDAFRRRARADQSGHWTAGLVLVTVGIIFMGERLGWSVAGSYWSMHQLWPVILIAVGLGAIATTRRFGSGMWMLAVGAIALLNSFHILRYRESWPLWIVAGGLAILFGGGRRERRPREEA